MAERAEKPAKLPVQRLLEWAFGVERAVLELPDPRGFESYRPAVGNEVVIAERLKLGGVRIDTSKGVSLPHDDADRIAEIVARMPQDLGGFWMARRVAQIARDFTQPDWMPGAKPKIEPREWVENQYIGRRGVTEVVGHYVETIKQPHPRAKNKRRLLKRKVRREIRWTPCTWVVSRQEIDSARDEYLRWRDALAWLRDQLRTAGLADHAVSDSLPPAKPWVDSENGKRPTTPEGGRDDAV